MIRLLLRALNSPALILLSMLGIAIQTSLFSFWPLTYLQPDIVLLLTVWCGLRRPFAEGGFITLIIAHIAEIHSGAPSGVFLINYMLLYMGVRGAARLLVIPDFSSIVLVILSASAFSKVATSLLLQLLGASGSQWRHALFDLVPEALVNGMIGKWLFTWLERFDWATCRIVHGDQALDNEIGELQVGADAATGARL